MKPERPQEANKSGVTDGYARMIDYLRISVTDRCNLRCRYCMPVEGVAPLPHRNILTYEEIARIVRLLARKKSRGPEPLLDE